MFLAGLTLAVLAGLAVVVIDYATRPLLAAGPMVQLVRPDGFSVVWWATRRGRAALEVDLPGNGTASVPATWDDAGQRVMATVDSLPAFAEPVEFRIVHRSWVGLARVIGRGRGRVAKGADEPLRFLVFGDSGSGKTAQYELGELMPRQSPDLVIHTGDLVYPKGQWLDYGPKFFQPYEALLREVPFYPCLGNHDIRTEAGRPFLAAFAWPDNGPPGQPRGAHYWFDCGPARFVTFDSDVSADVLKNVIAPWIEPILEVSVQEALVPIFERTRVDVVFNGHNHLYERTRSIRDGRIVPDGQGIFYIVSGAGGATLYPERANRPEYIAKFDDQMHGFTVVDVEGRVLRVRHINRLGDLVDDWTYTRPGS